MSSKSITNDKPRKRRSGGRSQKILDRAGSSVVRSPYIQRKLGTFNVLDEEGLALIEHNADLLLQETGMEFHDDPEILQIFHDAGADVKETRVRFEPGMCRSIIQKTAPRQFKQHARNPANTLEIGGDNTVSRQRAHARKFPQCILSFRIQ